MVQTTVRLWLAMLRTADITCLLVVVMVMVMMG